MLKPVRAQAVTLKEEVLVGGVTAEPPHPEADGTWPGGGAGSPAPWGSEGFREGRGLVGGGVHSRQFPLRLLSFQFPLIVPSNEPPHPYS